MEVKDKIIKAKVKLQKDNPFFAYLVMNLNLREDESVGSIGINIKGDCAYSPKWIDTLNEEELKGVLSHEVLHLALEHFKRNGNRDRTLFNIATDLAINNILVNNHFELPRESGGLVPYNNRFQFPNGYWVENLDEKIAEEIYEELKKEILSKEQIKELEGGRFDEHEESEDYEESEIKESQDKWKKAFSEASVYAKKQGKLPEGVDRLLDIVLNQKVNWKHLLYKYLTRTLPYDYTYSRPSKKSVVSGFYMPSILRENIEVVVSVDTSGSINKEELSEFLSEITNIARTFNNIKIKLIVCDSEIHETYEFGNGDDERIRNIKISGGGGTSHIPIYDYIENNYPNTKILVNFTDGFTDFPENERVKTIWVITKSGCNENDIPFGEVIKLN